MDVGVGMGAVHAMQVMTSMCSLSAPSAQQLGDWNWMLVLLPKVEFQVPSSFHHPNETEEGTTPPSLLM